MSEEFKKFVKALVPKPLQKTLLPIYHGAAAQLSSVFYGSPSNEMFVIGVTGTAGKSTTVMMLAHILNSAGFKTGYITTVGSSDGSRSYINKHGLSMPGGPLLQKTLHDFSSRGCKFAVIEATSEGLAQYRHLGITFKAALFTNLSPAHIEAHGSFEAYRAAKGKLFENLDTNSILGVNTDDPNYQFFLNFPAGRKFGTSTREDKISQTSVPVIRATNIKVTDILNFEIEGTAFELNLKGSFNIANALLAIGLAQYLGVGLDDSAAALKNFGTVPGRMETIPNNRGLTIIVDYAPEPKPLEESLRTAMMLDHKKLIHVFGATGGHRDTSKHYEFGTISARFADTIIITNDDVYDSDPQQIANHIREGITKVIPDQKKVSNIIVELDRRSALEKALSIAEAGDLILVTGKGSEQFLVLPGNERISWDDAKVIKELLK